MRKLLILILLLSSTFVFAFGQKEVPVHKKNSISDFINAFHEKIRMKKFDVLEEYYLNGKIDFYLQNNDLSATNLLSTSEVDHVFSRNDFALLYSKLMNIVGNFNKRIMVKLEYKESVYDSSESSLYIVTYETEYQHKKILETFFLKEVSHGFAIFKYQIDYRSDSYMY